MFRITPPLPTNPNHQLCTMNDSNWTRNPNVQMKLTKNTRSLKHSHCAPLRPYYSMPHAPLAGFYRAHPPKRRVETRGGWMFGFVRWHSKSLVIQPNNYKAEE